MRSDTSYVFSAVLVAETSKAGRGVETTYDLLTGLDAATAVSVIGGPVTIVAVGDDTTIPDSKEDHVFT